MILIMIYIYIFIIYLLYTIKFIDYLPGKNLILLLANSDLFHTLQEYVTAYINPYHIQLESEQTWPLEPLVQY